MFIQCVQDDDLPVNCFLEEKQIFVNNVIPCDITPEQREQLLNGAPITVFFNGRNISLKRILP